MDAKQVTHHLHGTWYGGYGTAPCPVCQCEARRDQNALTIKDGNERLLMNCKKGGCSFFDILAAAHLISGDYQASDPGLAAQRKAEQDAEAAKKAAQADACWSEASPIHGSPAEAYLRSRGITCDLPASLRCHPACWHGATAMRYPALIARLSGYCVDELPAIHRTYLKSDGGGKADVTPSKMMLGICAGRGVTLKHGNGPLVVAEGIETALSLMSGLIAHTGTVVASLSTSGMKRLLLPDCAGHLIVAPDGDPAGFSASCVLADRALALGWQVQVLPSPPSGQDYNDVLLARQGGIAA